MKKLIALVAVFSLVGFTMGCDGGSDTGTGPAATTPAATGPADTTPPEGEATPAEDRE